MACTTARQRVTERENPGPFGGKGFFERKGVAPSGGGLLPAGQGRLGDGASRPRARACSTASWRRCAPSLSYRWRMWVLTVFTDRYISSAISGAESFVGR